jgi:hypothetical protein
MTPRPGWSSRLIRAWTACYTAGLPGSAGRERRAEIDSDLAEHRQARLGHGWSIGRTTREQLWRTLRGGAADLAWRREVLATGSRSTTAVRTAASATATAASLAVAAFYVAFAAFLLGAGTLAQRPWLGGLDHYAEEVGSTGAGVAAIFLLGLGGLTVVACVMRPVAPLVANVTTMTMASLLVMWFWIGAAPIGALAVAAAAFDMALRIPGLRTSG